MQEKQMYMDSTVEHLEEFAKEGKQTTSTVRIGKSSNKNLNNFRFLLTNQSKAYKSTCVYTGRCHVSLSF